MPTNNFDAVMSLQELQTGELRLSGITQSRRMAMAAGLTKSSEGLTEAYRLNKDLYLASLQAAIAAYEENKQLEVLLVSTIARLASVTDVENSSVVMKALAIIKQSIDSDPS